MKELFSKNALLKNLTQKDLQFLEEQSRFQSFKKHHCVFLKGDKITSLFFVVKGHVRLFNRKPHTTKEKIVCSLGPFGIFCLAPLLSKETYHISAETLHASKLIAIPKSAVLKLIDHSHIFAKNVIQYLAKKEYSLCEEVCDLSLSTTKQRLAKFLLEQDELQRKPPYLIMPMNQSQLASTLGTVRETLARNLSDFKKAKIITRKKGGISLLKKNDLREISGFLNSRCVQERGLRIL